MMLMKVKNLIDDYFEKHYHLNNNNSISEQQTSDIEFDLEDKEKDFIVPYKKGLASFKNNDNSEISVLGYETFIKGYENRPSFTDKRRRCDFIIEDAKNKIIIFNEITSSKGGIENLEKPIGNTFSFGKFEKIEYQLADSVQTLRDVPQIGEYFNKLQKKICLCSYRLYSQNDKREQIIETNLNSFNRYSKIEAKQTGKNGSYLELSSNRKVWF